MNRDATIVRYEPCQDCTDGSCRSCGESSSEHAGPGVRLVVRQVKFVRCCASGCAKCGTNAHAMAAPGIAISVIEEHGARRWVPVVHLNQKGQAACGTSHASDAHLTTNRDEVTCSRCLKWR